MSTQPPPPAVTVTDHPAWTAPGGFALVGGIVLLVAALAALTRGAVLGVVGILLALLGILLLSSMAVVAPGSTRVVQFFGRYVGTVRRQGLVMVAPLTTRR